MSDWIREAKFVEKNFLEQLEAFELWQTHVVADKDSKHRADKALLGRSSFSEVLLTLRQGRRSPS